MHKDVAKEINSTDKKKQYSLSFTSVGLPFAATYRCVHGNDNLNNFATTPVAIFVQHRLIPSAGR